MKTIKYLLSFFLLFGVVASCYAEECRANRLPEKLHKLIEDKNYDEAIKQARSAVLQSNNKKQAEVVLAYVYVNATLQPRMSFDLSKLGFKPGEKGSKSVSPDQILSAMHDNFDVSSEYLPAAEKHIQSVIERWDEHKNLYYCLTKIYFYKPDHKQFLVYLQKTAESFKNEENEAVDYLITYASEFYKNKRFDLAEDVYTTLLKVFPKSTPVLSSLGVAYIAQGFTVKAAKNFDAAYKQNPDDEIVISNIAEVAMLMGDFEKADKFLRLKADKSTNKTPVFFDLAMNAMHAGPKSSLIYWDEYFKENENSPDERYWQENAKVIQNAAKNNSNDDDWISLAEQMIQINVPKYAIPILAYVNTRRPYDAGIRFHMAHAYDVGKHYELEEKSLLEVLKRLDNPKNNFATSLDNIYYNLSRCAYSLDRLSDAKSYLERVSSESKKMQKIDYMYALYYRDTGKKDIAKKYLNSCLNTASDKEFNVLCKTVLERLK